MSLDNFVELGLRHVFGGEQPFGLSYSDSFSHLYCLGKTGTGKSTLLRNIMIQRIESGEGAALIDVHGDLSHELLDYIPPWRTDDVVYCAPADLNYPIAFNPIQSVPQRSRHVAAAAVVQAFKSIWRESWGPRMEYVLYSCIATLLECQNSTLLGVQRLLVDERFREWAIRQVDDPSLRAFWTREFASWDSRLRAEVVSPIQNKIGQLTIDAVTRNILGQVASKFTPRFTMDRKRVLIVNLAKGLIGEDTANLLGALIVSQFQTAAMARADMPEQDRVGFTLVVDEFQNFITDSFAGILAEIRKYKLSLVLANQHLDQLKPEIRSAVFGNVGSMMAFRVGESDATVLSREFGSGFDPRLFSNLANTEVCVKLLEHGNQLDPFLARTWPPIGKRYGTRENIIRRSRERYATPRAVVEDKIRRWMNN
jgi:hypothetical protein